MESTGRSQRAVVYYCDEGIKGFDAPDEDPMKSAVTCDLILCPNCEVKRRIEYNNRPKVDFVIRVYVCHRFEVLSPLLSLRFT
jgi:hypothetical protein